jgi:hypothetical protein
MAQRNDHSRPETGPETGPNVDTVDARGAEIILKKRRNQIIFFAAMALITVIGIWAYTGGW